MLGDAIEAGSLVVERRDGAHHVRRLHDDAVFEDLEPRIVDLGGGDRIVVVKSYLNRGSALAVIGERDGGFAILAETPPIGTPHRWLNPAGVADFDGDGTPGHRAGADAARAGVLELWSLARRRPDADAGAGRRRQSRDRLACAAHERGRRFRRRRPADLAIPSFDRRELRMMAFTRPARHRPDQLPARVTTDIALLRDDGGMPVILAGLENGAVVAVRKAPKR